MIRYAVAIIALVIMSAASAGEWSGSIALETRLFRHDGADTRQDSDSLSMSFLPEYYAEWNDGRDSLTFEPFIRIDSGDSERTHADIRELMWIHVADNWELHLGIGKVFWGVTESRHLVDIINQTDLVENLDGEDKLGQPMAHLSWVRGWGTVDLFMLPGFRERTFPGKRGRLRTVPYVDSDLARYEDSRKQRHIDWAARWSRSVDIWDIGISHFSGTSREPRMVSTRDRSGNPVLSPFYDQINQTGLDVQATVDEWLLKLEWISRRGQGQRYSAMTAGFEYSVVGILDSAHDLGLLAEYLYDGRGKDSPGLFEDDLFMGARWVWNDSQDTEFLAGMVLDAGSSERSFRLEGSRRIGQGLKLNVEAQMFTNIPGHSSFSHFNREDFVQVELAWHF